MFASESHAMNHGQSLCWRTYTELIRQGSLFQSRTRLLGRPPCLGVARATAPTTAIFRYRDTRVPQQRSFIPMCNVSRSILHPEPRKTPR